MRALADPPLRRAMAKLRRELGPDLWAEVEDLEDYVERVIAERDEARDLACRLEEELARRPPL